MNRDRSRRRRAGVLAALALAVGLLLLGGCREPSDLEQLNQAKELTMAGKVDQARQAYRDFVVAHANSALLPEAVFGLAALEQYHYGDLDRALIGYKRTIGLFPDHPVALEALHRIAEIYLDNQRDYVQALKVYQYLDRKYAKVSGRGDEYLDRIAWCYFRMNDYDQVRAVYARLLKEYPDSDLAETAAVHLADSYYIQDRLPEALKAYENALVLYPKSKYRRRIIFRRANCLEESGRLEEAKKLYESLLPDYPNPDAVRIRLKGVKARLKAGVR